MSLSPGVYSSVPDDVYHADPAITPSASSSVLRALSQQSPLHAWHKHPRLNPDYRASQPTDAMIAGTILHSVVCGTPEPYEIGDYPDFRTKDAQNWRKDVYSRGGIPILQHKMDDLLVAATGIHANLAKIPQALAAIEAANKEVTLIWQERGALCRARYDILPPPSFGFSFDLKFTGLSAEPEQWGRKMVNDYLFQATLYPRGVKDLLGYKPEFRFLVCEVEPPYGVSMHAADPGMEDLGDRRLDPALDRWAACLSADSWPGYGVETHYQAAPSWELQRQENAEFHATIGESA